MLLVVLSIVCKSMCDPSILSDFSSGPAAACPGRISAQARSAAVLSPLRLMPIMGLQLAELLQILGERPAARQLSVLR